MTQEEAMGRCKEHIQNMKGKRTQLPRRSPPLDLGGRGGGSGDNSGEFEAATAMPASYGEFKDSTQEEEEEDMANCLILLGQGKSQKLSNPIALRGYECKTCSRCFPSFQALGGHRASHKKSPIGDDKKKKKSSVLIQEEEEEEEIDGVRTGLWLQTPNRRQVLSSSSSNYKKKYSKKVHECSICGAEFSSGQALGGHMRRHRTTTSSSDHHDHDDDDDHFQRVKKSRNNFSLDLNHPAPEDDDDDDDRRHCNSPFASSKEQVIVFSPSSLVDCHY